MAKGTTEFTLTSRTEIVHGIELPWQRRERYDRPERPKLCPIHSAHVHKFPGDDCTCRPVEKGTLIEEGTVFVPLSVLAEVCERTSEDAMFGVTPPMVGAHVRRALVQAGLADEETRGGIHGSKRGRKLLKQLHREISG